MQVQVIEEWRPIVGHEGLYEISDAGAVRRVRGGAGVRAGRVLRTFPTTWGYHTVSLHKEGRQRSYKVHRLVVGAFMPQPDDAVEVNHKDGNPANNRVENLEWVTRSENLRHSHRVLGRKSIPPWRR